MLLFNVVLYTKQLLLGTTDHIGQSNQNLAFSRTRVTMQLNDFCQGCILLTMYFERSTQWFSIGVMDIIFYRGN